MTERNFFEMMRDRSNNFVTRTDGSDAKKILTPSQKLFSDVSVYKEMNEKLAYVHRGVIASLAFPENTEERNRFRNNAVEPLKEVYALIENECKLCGCTMPEYGLTVGRKMIDYWADHGIFAQIKNGISDDGKPTKIPVPNSVTKLRNAVYDDVYNILNNIERRPATKDSLSTQKAIDAANNFRAKQAEKRAKEQAKQAKKQAEEQNAPAA